MRVFQGGYLGKLGVQEMGGAVGWNLMQLQFTTEYGDARCFMSQGDL